MERSVSVRFHTYTGRDGHVVAEGLPKLHPLFIISSEFVMNLRDILGYLLADQATSYAFSGFASAIYITASSLRMVIERGSDGLPKMPLTAPATW